MPNLGGPELVVILGLFMLPLAALALWGVYTVVRLALRKELQRSGVSPRRDGGMAPGGPPDRAGPA